jgi:hypothetical protein
MADVEGGIVFTQGFDAASAKVSNSLRRGNKIEKPDGKTYDLTVTSFFQLLFLPHAVRN